MLTLFPGNTRLGFFIKSGTVISAVVIGYLIYKYGFEKTNTLIGILTPFVLLAWFFYSQRQILHNEFNNELKGIYSDILLGRAFEANNEMREAVIINISQVNLQGEFVGELTYIRTELGDPNTSTTPKINNHPYIIYGQINYFVMLNTRYDVRKYGGEFKVVSRPYRQNINQTPDEQNVVIRKYKIVFHREVQSLFIMEDRKSVYKHDSQLNLPWHFFVYKKLGLINEPHELIKRFVLFENGR